ncbi:MAG: NAD+ synthase [Candidatus Hodarchaeales archaeon]|jgi:NAD+ synthase
MSKKDQEISLEIPALNSEHTSKVIENFIKTRVTEAKAKGVVLGISGGIDSAVVLTLAVRALGHEKVEAFFLQNKGSSPDDIKDVQGYCKLLRVKLTIIDIQSVIDSFASSINELEDTNLLEWMNIKPRILQTYLYFFANKNNYLVCGGGNKSELMIGYFTKYGDGGVDILPIGDVYKSHVFQLAEYLKLPSNFINKPPSAGLKAGQTDEAEIGMRYSKLDSILYGLEMFQTDQKIADHLNIPLIKVKKVHSMIYKSEHKRRAPLIIKLGVRTPTIDWRIPLIEPSEF